jgi:hypothetical protein
MPLSVAVLTAMVVAQGRSGQVGAAGFDELQAGNVEVLLRRILVRGVLGLRQNERRVRGAADVRARKVAGHGAQHDGAVEMLEGRVTFFDTGVAVAVDEVPLRQDADRLERIVESFVREMKARVQDADDHARAGVAGAVQGHDADLLQLGLGRAVARSGAGRAARRRGRRDFDRDFADPNPAPHRGDGPHERQIGDGLHGLCVRQHAHGAEPAAARALGTSGVCHAGHVGVGDRQIAIIDQPRRGAAQLAAVQSPRLQRRTGGGQRLRPLVRTDSLVGEKNPHGQRPGAFPEFGAHGWMDLVGGERDGGWSAAFGLGLTQQREQNYQPDHGLHRIA